MAKGGYRGGMPMGGMNMNMMKQAQKMQQDLLKMQEEMEKIQTELEDKTVEASSGGGAVNVVVSGKKEIVSIKIQPEAVDPEDVETLEDLVMTAVNEAIKKADDMMTEGMSAVTGGLNIPGLF